VERARRATRIAALKLVWVAVSLGLSLSVLTELTQPHPSPYTAIFGVAWVAVTVWIFREIRRLRVG
jgi:hypothetical protein